MTYSFTKIKDTYLLYRQGGMSLTQICHGSVMCSAQFVFFMIHVDTDEITTSFPTHVCFISDVVCLGIHSLLSVEGLILSVEDTGTEDTLCGLYTCSSRCSCSWFNGPGSLSL